MRRPESRRKPSCKDWRSWRSTGEGRPPGRDNREGGGGGAPAARPEELVCMAGTPFSTDTRGGRPESGDAGQGSGGTRSAGIPPAGQPRLAAGRWRVDPAHSHASFAARGAGRAVRGSLPLTGEGLMNQPVEGSTARLAARTGAGSP